MAYLRVENPRFLFLGGSADVVAATGVAAAAPPAVSVARAGASAARVASLVGYLATGVPAPARGAVSSAASAARGEGVKAPSSRGEPGPRRFPPPPRRPTTSTPRSRGRRAPAARVAETPHSSIPGAPAAGCSAPSCAPPAPALPAAPRARMLGLGAWAGRTAQRSWPLSAKNRQGLKTHRYPANRQNKGRRKYTHQWADREHGKHPEGRVVALGSPEVDGASRPCGRVLPREEVRHQP
jgi:hypothetical protein